jgi:hypothetical protein
MSATTIRTIPIQGVLNSNHTYVILGGENVAVGVRHDGDRCAIARRDIPKHSVVLLEHGLQGTPLLIGRAINEDAKLFENLYPRIAVGLNRNRATLCRKKADCNQWQSIDGSCQLGLAASVFNHSCSFNCVTLSVPMVTGVDFRGAIIACWACKDVKQGDELTISYGSGVGHERSSDHDISCSCCTSQAARDLAVDVVNQLDVALALRSAVYNPQVKQVLDQYLASRVCYTRVHNQDTLMSSVAGGEVVVQRLQALAQSHPELHQQLLLLAQQ